MCKIDIINRWYADLYDQQETYTDDVNFMLSVIGEEPRNVLEACCGSGRILVPLAKAGHTVTGFDADEDMLGRIPHKAADLSNISFSKADAIADDWGKNFDVVILAGNILINIVSDMNYKEAQKLFIKKAYNSLKLNGRLYLDFGCFAHPENFFENSEEKTVFEGTDSFGYSGKYIIFDGRYDEKTQTAAYKRKIELVSKIGEKIVQETTGIKHIPTLLQVKDWLNETGFKVINQFGDYKGNPISEETYNAIIWAEKIQ